jgi:hypothetical protein
LQDVSKLVGLWYSPYLKIYSTGGDERIAEISTYPRAYRKTITEEYEDEETKEKRTGSYEVWAESKDLFLTFQSTKDNHVFDIVKDAFTGQLVNVEILEAQVSKDGGKFEAVKTSLDSISKLSEGNFSMAKAKDDPDKMLLMVRYNRRFS